MWIDPLLYDAQLEPTWLNANQRWSTPTGKPQVVETMSWGEWLRLLAVLCVAVLLLITKRTEHPEPQPARLTLRELRSYPLHRSGENGTPFSAN